MNVSAKSRYALKIMTYLAEHRLSSVSVSQLAEGTGISAKYAEQIMAMLKRAGYVQSKRGSMGGYTLAAFPREYRISDILRLTEGIPEADDGENPVSRMFKEADKAAKAVLDRYTVADLINR